MSTFEARPLAIALALLGVVMLLATIFYPFGYDQAVFSVGGEMVMRGGIPIRDFLDTKPPLIFYLYAAAIGLFGRHEWSVHLLDIVYQLGAAYYFFRILRRQLSSDVSLAAVSLTIILYAGSGFWMTAEAESFAIIPSLLLVDMTMRAISGGPRKAFYFGLLTGIASFALLLLKFTLVFGAAAAILFVAIRSGVELKSKWRFVAGLLLSVAALTCASALLLWKIAALHPFLEWLGWLWQYGSIGNTHGSLFEQLLILFPQRLVYSTSISLFVLGVWGIVCYLRRSRQPVGEFGPAENAAILRLLALIFVFQLLGVLVERKIEFPYQYTRALWAFAPFMAIGLLAFFREITKLRKAGGFARITLFVGLVLLIAAMSPLARIFTQTIPWAAHALRNDASAEVQRRIPDYFAEEQHQVADYLSAKMSGSDQFFVWGNDVAIYFFTNKLPQTLCLTATPLRSEFTPKEWKEKLLRQLTTAPPKYFVAEFGDAKPYITGSPLDSYAALLHWKELENFLFLHYERETTIGHFLIFRLNQSA